MSLEIIAHRGFSAIAPENTFLSYEAAIKRGADSIEFDIQLSADRVAVVIHDVTLEKTTGIAAKVEDKTLEELKQLDAGGWFSPEFSGQKIPTLQEVLNWVKPIKQHIYLDVKPYCTWTEAEIEKLVQLLIDTGWQKRCIVSSFNQSFVEQVHRQNPNLTLGYIVADTNNYQSQLKKAANTGAVLISEYHLLLENPDLVAATKEKGIEIVAWTVDSAKDVEKLTQLGVRRIVTNSLIGLPEA